MILPLKKLTKIDPLAHYRSSINRTLYECKSNINPKGVNQILINGVLCFKKYIS